MISCGKCKDRGSCVKVCEAIEGQLRAEGIYSADYIRPQLPPEEKVRWGNWREIPFSACNRDKDGNTSHMLRDY